MNWGTMQLVAYKYDQAGQKIPAEFTSQIFAVQNNQHLTATWGFSQYEREPTGGDYAWAPFVVSSSDDCLVVLQNLEDTDNTTFYIFFFNSDNNPIGVGYAATVGPKKQARCSVKMQTATREPSEEGVRLIEAGQ